MRYTTEDGTVIENGEVLRIRGSLYSGNPNAERVKQLRFNNLPHGFWEDDIACNNNISVEYKGKIKTRDLPLDVNQDSTVTSQVEKSLTRDIVCKRDCLTFLTKSDHPMVVFSASIREVNI
ncbi:MAG: hypothetical protein ABIB79_01000 [archaeon]